MATATTFLGRQLNLIRRYTDEPSIGSKYSDEELIEQIEAATQTVLAELHTSEDAPIVVRHAISVNEGAVSYLLPPNVEAILRIAKLNETTGLPDYMVEPTSIWSWNGPGLRLEGRTLRFDPVFSGATDTLEIMYVPNGDIRLHYGTGTSPTATTLTLAASPTLGTLDTRENCYVGCVLRVVSDTNGYIQERTITAYDRTTRVATVFPAFDPTPSGTITYEVAPTYGRFVEQLISFYVAHQLRAVAGDLKKAAALQDQYVKARRILRMQLNRVQGIVSDRFEHDTAQSYFTRRYWR